MSLPLVAIGDSLTQGMTHGSICKTEIAYPNLIAACLSQYPFNRPDFMGEGGIPLNLEQILRNLQTRVGSQIHWYEVISAMQVVWATLDRTEDYWERGLGASPFQPDLFHHNLAVSGFQMGDCDTLSEAVCTQELLNRKYPRWLPQGLRRLTSNWAWDDDLVRQLPTLPLYRNARRTLNRSFNLQYGKFSQVEVARHLAETEGGIDNLIFWLGSNNCLGTVTGLKLKPSTREDIDKLPHERTCNLWEVEHFQILCDRVAPKIAQIGAKNVFIGTIPHITIPPVTRGISPGKKGNAARNSKGYYDFYTHFWVWDDDFSREPHKYPKLTAQQAEAIDRNIDGYNEILRRTAQKYGWHIVDICEQLDRLAYRRQGGNPTYNFPLGLIAALQELKPSRVSSSGEPLLDTRFLRILPEGGFAGGLIGLDGFHPTPVCYGLIAYEFLEVMRQAGVAINMPKRWWETIVESDSILMDMPESLRYLEETLSFLEHRTPLLRLLRIWS
ncbi:MAG: hypothetical protein SAJ12_05095 [Jaaginema sp. PMC 1079.18]|nr:hypothetical protein [Jaaginema sp. PMC 1080.18]MEC4850370.1 hypothetical protein [Jaaginema sp. PMC 1079.18]MEC4864990.1 hypothetical protein [Jaaginema sp. PMC 1078.18]